MNHKHHHYWKVSFIYSFYLTQTQAIGVARETLNQNRNVSSVAEAAARRKLQSKFLRCSFHAVTAREFSLTGNNLFALIESLAFPLASHLRILTLL